MNAEENEAMTKQFLELYGLKSLVRASTCFKSLNNPSCIDLILTNCYRSFQNTSILPSGLSDCHKMVITVMKTRYPKAKPRHIFCRNYKLFDKVTFNDHLLWYLQATPAEHIHFCNEVPYMTKPLRKAIMTRSRLENKYLKTKLFSDKDMFKKQRNYCNRLYKRERKRFYKNIDLKNITDNKKFWCTMKPFFTDKGTSRNSTSLIEGCKIIVEDMEIAETLNTYFEYAVSSLGISEPKEFITSHENLNDPIDSILLKYSKHPSILMIKAIELKSTFSFNESSLTEIQSEINALNTKKSNPANSVPVKHLKEHIDICSEFLYEIINHNIRNSKFDDGMKLADSTPIHKKDEVAMKSNYRPISGLSAGSKIFERIIQRQIALHMETF